MTTPTSRSRFSAMRGSSVNAVLCALPAIHRVVGCFARLAVIAAVQFACTAPATFGAAAEAVPVIDDGRNSENNSRSFESILHPVNSPEMLSEAFGPQEFGGDPAIEFLTGQHLLMPELQTKPLEQRFEPSVHTGEARSSAPEQVAIPVAATNRPSPMPIHDSLVTQCAALQPVEAPRAKTSLAQPEIAAQEAQIVTTPPEVATTSPNPTRQNPSPINQLLGLRNQLLGEKRNSTSRPVPDSEIAGAHDAPSNTASPNSSLHTTSASAPTPPAPANLPTNSIWFGLTRQFSSQTNEPLSRKTSDRQGPESVPANATQDAPESERVPALLHPFYQTNSLPQNSQNDEQQSQSRALGLGENIEHSVRNSSLVRQLSLPANADLRATPTAVSSSSTSTTRNTPDNDSAQPPASRLSQIKTLMFPEKPSNRSVGVTPAAFLNEESLPPPARGDQPTKSVLRGDAEGDDSKRATQDARAGEGTPNNNVGGNEQRPKSDKLATAEQVGEKPEDRSLEFLRAETVLLKPGKHQFDIGFQYAIQERSFPILFNSIDQSGPIDDVHVKTTSDKALSYNVDQARFKTRQLTVPMQLRCGVLEHVQVFVGAPVGWSNTEVDLNHFDEERNDGGIGDIYWGSTIQFREAQADCPYVIGTVVATAPSGGDPFTGVTGFAPTSPSLGNGFWRLAGNLLFIQPLDPVTFFYGCGLRGSFAHDYIGNTFQPGMEYNYTFGMGFAINEKVTLSSQLFGAFQSELRANGQPIDGSSQEPIALQLAATVARPCEHYVQPYVQFGVTRDAPSVNFGVTWTY